MALKKDQDAPVPGLLGTMAGTAAVRILLVYSRDYAKMVF